MAAKTVCDLNFNRDVVELPVMRRSAAEQRKVMIDTTRTDGNIGIVLSDGSLTDFTNTSDEPDWVLLIPTAQLQAAVVA